ncbi:hypothetical protein [Streptomyces sp. NBC_00498]|uniref:hypothetical protein n=1 Tax=Streptomyces sp. NBC_00498 TaxID=2975760 RepID=UPI002E18BCA1
MAIYVVRIRGDGTPYPQPAGRTTLLGEAPVPGSDDPISAPGRPTMLVLLLVLLAVLFGLGFLNSLWWVAAIVLVIVYVHYGRDSDVSWGRRNDSRYEGYGEYRDHRDREDRWDRRYRRQRRGRKLRQDRRDRERRR